LESGRKRRRRREEIKDGLSVRCTEAGQDEGYEAMAM
jgi:hypothetical protein